MKTSLYFKILVPLFFCITDCKSSSFSGGNEAAKEESKPKTQEQQPVHKASPTATPTPSVTPTSTPNLKPDDIVDGQEVFNDCQRCVQRASELSQKIGFKADKNKTINLGYYKIAASKGLCDIHFMSNMNLKVDDHEGQDSIGNGQIILYCPCNCGWAVDQSNGPF